MKTTKMAIIYLLCGYVLFQLTGCVSAAYLGVGALIDGKNASTNYAVTPGVTGEQLRQIRKVVFIFGEKNPSGENPSAMTGNLGTILEDNIVIEMMKLGYECVESRKIKKNLEEQGIKITGEPPLEDSINAGKRLGIDAIIEGDLSTMLSSNASALSYKSSFGAQIQSVNLKLVDVKAGNTLMVMSINYKRGENPDKAARHLSELLKERMQTNR